MPAPHGDLIALSSCGRFLLWRAGTHPRDLFRTIKPQRGTLERFLRLADVPAENILAYARRWGVLGLCRHGLPMNHAGALCDPAFLDGQIAEPLTSWRALAKAAAALLRLNAFARLDRMGRTDVLSSLWHDALWLPAQQFDWARKMPKGSRRAFAHFGRREAAMIATEWLRAGGVCVQVQWDQPSFRFELAPNAAMPNLFGALAIALAFEMAGLEAWALCAGCGELMQPSPNAGSGTRRFCPGCRAANQPACRATGDYRARKRAARRLASQGRTAAWIAKSMGKPVERIRAWIDQ